jgi:hypothetical protein
MLVRTELLQWLACVATLSKFVRKMLLLENDKLKLKHGMKKHKRVHEFNEERYL